MLHACVRDRGRAPRVRQRGGAAVEFAIVLPLFCAVLFGIIDYGWYFYQKFTLASAIRNGVRTGVTVARSNGSGDEPYALALSTAKTNLDQGSVPSSTVTFGPSTHYSGSSPTEQLTMSGTYTFHPLVGFVPLPKNAMTYTMTMLLEQQTMP